MDYTVSLQEEMSRHLLTCVHDVFDINPISATLLFSELFIPLFVLSSVRSIQINNTRGIKLCFAN